MLSCTMNEVKLQYNTIKYKIHNTMELEERRKTVALSKWGCANQHHSMFGTIGQRTDGGSECMRSAAVR